MKGVLYIRARIASACVLGGVGGVGVLGGLSGCIEEYVPRLDTVHESILVVDGIITDGETMIRLSRSKGLNEEESFQFDDDFSTLWVTRATVWIETESGQRLEQTREEADGTYFVTTGLLDENEKYRVKIRTTDGKEFESEFRTPRPVPPIDAIEFLHAGGTEPVRVGIDATGAADHTGFYRWAFEETWEVNTYHKAGLYLGRHTDENMTPLSLSALGDSGVGPIFFGPTGSPFYRGWISQTSRSLLLGETSRLSQNVLRDFVLYEFDVSDNRISVLYHTKITQFALGEDAYFYMNNLKRNTDETGSIFAPIPSEMPGNLVCVTDPDTPVIGFVEASRQERKEIFLSSAESPYIAPYPNCPAEFSTVDPIRYDLFPFSDGTDEEGRPALLLTERDCMDCRYLGASPERPAWWPADS